MIISLYGRLADMLGRDLPLSLPEPCTVADVRREIGRLHPAAAGDIGSSRSRACVNDALAGEQSLIAADDEVAFLPPLSGG